jgi:dihydroflavonol-4-reductase
MVVLNPVGIFGPVLSQDASSSISIIEDLLTGTLPGCPNVHFGLVDVRDVADIEVKALTNPQANGQRFILTGGRCLALIEIAQILRANLGARAAKVTSRVIPDFMMKVLSIFSAKDRAFKSDLGIVRNASNDKAVRTFQWSPIPIETTLIDTAESLFRVGKVVL